MKWQTRERAISCADGVVVMGIVNVTPDSFYDGGKSANTAAAVDRALQLVEEGAGIIDIGGESSRPALYGDVRVVPAEEECARVVPAIAALRRQTGVPISVDTVKVDVARRALDAGAEIINDISALTADAGMEELAATSGAGVVLMHMRGAPRTMQRNTHYDDLLGEVAQYLERRLRCCQEAGIAADRIAVDPGVGFGKSLCGNLELIAGLEQFAALGQPLMVGASRKSFIWRTLGLEVDEALEGSLAVAVISVLHGAHILRVHDVGPTVRAVRMAAAVMGSRACADPLSEAR
jgi:dihydropteroate synthase